MELRDTLQHVYLFRGADGADIDAVAAIAETQSYPAGTHIFDHGHDADAFFVVIMGTVELHAEGKDLAVVTVGSGQTFGELPFFRRHLRPASAYTRETTHVARIPYQPLERLLAERPGLAVVFYRNAAGFFAQHVHQMGAERERPYL
jgi:CRP/FNR family transcriptional regulator, cyclic AMP receptor protein